MHCPNPPAPAAQGQHAGDWLGGHKMSSSRHRQKTTAPAPTGGLEGVYIISLEYQETSFFNRHITYELTATGFQN